MYDTYEQYLRLASLLTVNDCITDATEALPVFLFYSFVPGMLYDAIDGQNLALREDIFFNSINRSPARAR
ncbi:hypothetical protein LMR84_26410 [Klebsiella variicola]|nr:MULTISPECIES: hypothetical protein [Klebsiella]MCC5458508.1 hypothetical protein [Klebsiella variicola]HDX8940688.1 hypothetical protein [Klebsiella michiganensis]